MCGVSGILRRNPSGPDQRLKKMSESLKHRGPDGEGYFHSGHFHLNHRLLRIHSSKTPPGPYTSSNGRWTLSFNGEIYNEGELRAELEKSHAISWRYHSDAEVLLEGWALHGESFLQKINGMFAFAMWDNQEHRLYLVRDRLGQKPMYFTFSKDEFLFASEIKAFKAIGLPMRANQSALSDYLSYRYVSGPETLFKDIYKLLPAHYLVIDKNLNSQLVRYWQIPEETEGLSRDEKARRLLELIESAIRICTPKSPPTLFLSGGIDSATLASFLPRNSRSFTFSSLHTVPEIAQARQLSEKFGLNHLEVQDASSDELLRKAVWATEEPLGDSILIPGMALSNAAAQYSRVVISGEGADEIFGGYIHHLTSHHLFQAYRFLGKHGLHAINKAVSIVPSQFFRYLAPYSAKAPRESQQRLRAALKNLANHGTLGSALSTLQQIDFDSSKRAQGEASVRSLRDLIHLDLQTWLPDYTLLRMDKLLMANGLEGRLPYLDHRLVELTASFKANDFVQGRHGKFLFRQALSTHLGKEIAWQKKISFLYNTTPKTSDLLTEKQKFTHRTLKLWQEIFEVEDLVI